MNWASNGPKKPRVELTQILLFIAVDSVQSDNDPQLDELPLGLTRLKKNSLDYIYLKAPAIDNQQRIHIWIVETSGKSLRYFNTIYLDKKDHSYVKTL
ncbi:MAG: hypothetical protein HOP11_01545 [Saprospiraceae bacterium]|nr:hypothetical protein [Saprospiraceae bacterium]